MIDKIKILFDLTVPQYLLVSFFGFLSASFIISPAQLQISMFPLPILSFFLAVLGLNAFNQIFDMKEDSISKPSRPIPSHKLSRTNALLISVILFLMSICLATATMKWLFLLVILVFIIVSILYSMPPIRLKRFFLSSNLVGGTLHGALLFLGAWTIFASDGQFPFVFFLIFWGLAISIASIKDLEDIEGDKKTGIQTLPIKIGTKKTLYAISMLVFLILFVGLSLTLHGTLNINFIFSFIFSFLLLIIVIFFFTKKLKIKKTVTQARIVTITMVLVILMQLSFGLVSLFT